MSSWEESEDIYHGTVPVLLKHLDREERTAALRRAAPLEAAAAEAGRAA